ncbi:hypothetical protein D3C86_1814480 [compost metagenome]
MARRGDVVGIESRNRLAQSLGLQQDAQTIGVHRVFTDQGCYHCPLVRDNLQQGLCFQLAQCFAHRHPAHTEQRGKLLLAQRRSAGQSPIDNGVAQPFLDDGPGQMWLKLFAG